MALLGIDIGTSSTKGIVVDEGKVIAEASVPHGIEMPKPGYAEHDAEMIWWGDIKKVCRELLKSAKNIEAIGISALCPDMLPVDKDGKPIRKAVLYGIDSRATKEIKEVENRIGKERIFEVCGNILQSQSVGPKILWFMNSEPELFKKAFKIHTASSYALYKLTGEHCMDMFTASMYHPLYNIKKLGWDKEMLADLNIPHSLLPELKWPTEIAGYISKKASEETELKEGTPVITGMCDAVASTFSAGLEKENEMCVFMGTTTCMFLVQNEIKKHPMLWAMPYFKKGKYLLGGGTSSTGAIVQWFRDNFAHDKSYEELDEEAERAGISDIVLLPYFMGERTPILDERAKGMLFGLRIEHTGANVYRAILEATAYAIRHHLDIMDEAGARIEKIMLVNGGSKSRVWRQIISDVLQRKVYRTERAYGAPFGDAYAAGMGIGKYKDLKQVKEFLGKEEVTEPEKKNKESYDKLYEIYLRLYKKTKEEMHDLG